MMTPQSGCSPEALQDFARDILMAAGMRGAHAELVAETLVFADMRGTPSHGVARLSLYLDRVAAGVMQIDATPVEVPGCAGLLDAGNGFGQVAAALAMDMACARAADGTGAAAVAVRGSNHFGVAAYFVRRAALAGRIGIVLTNASPAMAPWNARTRLVGTNPLAIGLPASVGAEPLVLDMSTSLVARGKIRRAEIEGRPIPEGWAVDADGRPTTDAAAAMKGLVAPVGGPKGAGLSLMIDLLTGVLSGTGLTGNVRNIADVVGPSGTGHLMIALDVASFRPLAAFRDDVGAVAAMIRAMPAVDGTEIMLPGEPEARTAEKARAEGVTLPAAVVADLARLARNFDHAATV